MERKTKQYSLTLTQEQWDVWKKVAPMTVYKSLAEFIRCTMDGVCQCILDSDKTEVLIITHDIDDTDYSDVDKYLKK